MGDPTGRIAAIQRSRRCLVCGGLGLLPLVGLPFALLALWHGTGLRSPHRTPWNPGARWVNLGMLWAALGVGFSLFLILAIFLRLSNII